MDSDEFRKFGKAAIDFVADYMETLRDRQVLPSVSPGYLQPLMPEEPPEEPGQWEDVMSDMHRIILPGMTHWSSPQFHSYFPTANSYPAIVGDLLSTGFGCVGFSWIASPVCTELEVVVMNWMAKLLELPEEFHNSSEGVGGGVIQGSASETTFLCLLAAKERKVRHLNCKDTNEENSVKSKLIAYTSDQSNSSVEKAGILSSVPMRLLKSDENGKLRGNALAKAMEEDIENGLIPCYVVATFGTTGTCAFDVLEELGPICQKYDAWLHVDAAYAGAALACPEFRNLMSGINLADSFNFNPHKWMLVNFDCSALWVKNSMDLIQAFDVQRIYLKDNDRNNIPDYRHWQISLGRRFRSLKVWIVMKIYGAEGIRKHIRNQVRLAQVFSKKVKSDKRFEVVAEALGLVCFRLKSGNESSKVLYDKIIERKNLYMVTCTHKNKYVIRFVICSRNCNDDDVDFAWNEIKSITDEIEPIECRNHIKNISIKHIKISDETSSDKFIHNMTTMSKIEEKSK